MGVETPAGISTGKYLLFEDFETYSVGGEFNPSAPTSSTTNDYGHFQPSTAFSVAGLYVVTNEQVCHGTKAMKVTNTTNSQQRLEYTNLGLSGPTWFCGYYYIPTLTFPSQDDIALVTGVSGVYVRDNGTMEWVLLGAGAISTFSYTVGAWIRIELYWNPTTRDAAIRYFSNKDATTPTYSNTANAGGSAATIGSLVISGPGWDGSTYYLDTIGLSQTDWIGPFTQGVAGAYTYPRELQLTGLSGTTAAVQDRPSSPDANWLTVS